MVGVDFVNLCLLHLNLKAVSACFHGTHHLRSNWGGQVLDIMEPGSIVGGVKHGLQQCSTDQNAHGYDASPPW